MWALLGMRRATNLQSTDWFYQSIISKIKSIKSRIRKNKIPSSKHQITNKSQISIFNDQNRWGFEFWLL